MDSGAYGVFILFHFLQGTLEGKPYDIQHAQPEIDERVAIERQQTTTRSGRRT